MYNMNIINPAYAGSSDATSVGILYRNQWDGIDGAPKTGTMNIHFPAGKNVGLGFQQFLMKLAQSVKLIYILIFHTPLV